MFALFLNMNQRNNTFAKNQWNRYWSTHEYSSIQSTSGRMAKQLLPYLGPGRLRILELGCGSGTDSRQLSADKKNIVFALDFSWNALNKLKLDRKESGSNLTLICADVQALPFKNESVDVIMHQGLLEHFTNGEKILMEQSSVLKMNGLLLVDVPQRYHIYTALKHACIGLDKWPFGWETEFSPRKLISCATKAGFRTETLYGYWSRPAFIYRVLRAVLKYIKIGLPLNLQASNKIRIRRDSFRERISGWPLVCWTAMDIGLITRKRMRQDG